MSNILSCAQCHGVMVLEDLGEMLGSDDVMAYFGYRCLSCGHVEENQTGFERLDNQLVQENQPEVQYAS